MDFGIKELKNRVLMAYNGSVRLGKFNPRKTEPDRTVGLLYHSVGWTFFFESLIAIPIVQTPIYN